MQLLVLVLLKPPMLLGLKLRLANLLLMDQTLDFLLEWQGKRLTLDLDMHIEFDLLRLLLGSFLLLLIQIPSG